MKYVYHTTSTADKETILNNGLQRQDHALLNTNQIQLEDGYYFLPENETAPADYAQKLVWTLLEENKPTQYPSHHNCIFFFSSENLLGELDRAARIQVNTTAFNSLYPIYQAPFDIATDLFFNTMSQFKITNEISATTLLEKIEKYWKNTQEITTKEEIQSDMEILVNTDRIEQKYCEELRE